VVATTLSSSHSNHSNLTRATQSRRLVLTRLSEHFGIIVGAMISQTGQLLPRRSGLVANRSARQIRALPLLSTFRKAAANKSRSPLVTLTTAPLITLEMFRTVGAGSKETHPEGRSRAQHHFGTSNP
jgi:hypothetical protein